MTRNVVLALLVGMGLKPFIAFGDAMTCGSIQNAFGPFDYRDQSLTAVNKPRELVERAHFTPEVRNLSGGHTAAGPALDLDYTLRAFPNHHEALMVMVNYYTDPMSKSRPPMRYSAECYFDRALRFAPDDASVWLIYGIYLNRIGRKEEALQKLQQAAALAPESPEVNYNLGLMFFKLGRYDESLKHARIAYKNNYPLPGLKRDLMRRGLWPKG